MAIGFQITLMWCEESGAKPGEDNSTHHLIPRAAGGGAQQMVCRYCKKTERLIKQQVGRTLPPTWKCPIGSYSAHTFNAEQDECIWCGPRGLAWKPGHWVKTRDQFGAEYNAWTATEPFEYGLKEENDGSSR